MEIIKRHWFDLVLIVLWIGCGISVIANGSVSVVAYGCLLFCFITEKIISIMYKELVYRYKEREEEHNVQ